MFVVASFARQTFDNSLQLLLLLHGLWRCSSLVSSFVWPDHLLLGCDAISLRSSYYNCTYYYYYYTTRQLTERAAGGGKLTLLPAALTWSCQSFSDRPTEWYPHTHSSSVSLLRFHSVCVCGSIGRCLVVLSSGRRHLFSFSPVVCVFSFANFFPLWFGSRRPSIPSSRAKPKSQVLTSAIYYLFYFFFGWAFESLPSLRVTHRRCRTLLMSGLARPPHTPPSNK